MDVFSFIWGDVAKKKWKNLRDTFAKNVKCSITKTRRYGYTMKGTKKWLWADAMKKFRPFLAPTRTANGPLFSELKSEACAEESETMQSEHSENGAPPEDSNPVYLQITQPEATCPQKTEVKKHRCEPSMGEMMEYFESRKRTEQDATDCLFLAHAKTIKTFSARRQALTKMKIAEVIMEQELLDLEEMGNTGVPMIAECESIAVPSR